MPGYVHYVGGESDRSDTGEGTTTGRKSRKRRFLSALSAFTSSQVKPYFGVESFGVLLIIEPAAPSTEEFVLGFCFE